MAASGTTIRSALRRVSECSSRSAVEVSVAHLTSTSPQCSKSCWRQEHSAHEAAKGRCGSTEAFFKNWCPRSLSRELSRTYAKRSATLNLAHQPHVHHCCPSFQAPIIIRVHMARVTQPTACVQVWPVYPKSPETSFLGGTLRTMMNIVS